MVSMRMTPVLLKTHDPIWHLLVKSLRHTCDRCLKGHVFLVVSTS